MTWVDVAFGLLMCFGLAWFVWDMARLRQMQKRLRDGARFGLPRCLACNRPAEDHTNLGRCTDGSGNHYT